MGGMSRSFTREVTILLNAAPTMTATARSSTFPRITNAWNSLSMTYGVIETDLILPCVIVDTINGGQSDTSTRYVYDTFYLKIILGIINYP